MDFKELLKHHAYACCLNWLLMVGILKVLNYYYELRVMDILILILPLIWIILLRSFDQNKKNIIPYLMIVLIAIILYAVIQVSNYPFIKEANKYFKWLGKLVKQGDSDSFLYSIITICFFLFVVSIPVYLLLRQYNIRLILAVILFVALIVGAVTKQELSKLSVSCFLTFILMSAMEGRLNAFYKKFQTSSVNVMTFLLPFALLMTVWLLILPVKKEPIQWEFFKNCWKSLTSMVEGWGNDIDLWFHPEKAEFSLNFFGYSEDGEVGGSLEGGGGIPLSVELTTTQTTNIYLTGNIKNQFDGREWSLKEEEASYLNTANEYEYDLYELAYAMQREEVTSETYRDYFKTRTYDITYEDILTKAMFYPLKISMVQNYKNADSFSSEKANIRFDEAQGEGTRYKVSCIQLNLGSDTFDQLIVNQSQFRYQDDNLFDSTQFRKYLKNITLYSNAKVPENLEELLYRRSIDIQNQYTSVYESLPKRVSDLAEEITKDYVSKYEKLLALENYFSTYTYTTQPSQPEKGQDMIDYLLFESKEGYCTYYATALAVMGRCIGIPTRYVQGFCVEYANQPDRYQFFVSNRNAHAWVEAYIEGIGWLPFEPTPTYDGKLYDPWTTKANTTVNKNQPTVAVIMGGEEDEEGRITKIQNLERKLAYQSVTYVLIIIVIVLLLAVPIYLLLKQAYRNKLYKQASTKQKVYMDVCLLLSVFRYCTRKIETGETFCSYMGYIRTQYPNKQKNLTDLELIFLRLRYNEEELSLEEQRTVEEIKEDMLREIHNHLKKIKYLRMRVYLLQIGYKGI